MAISLVSTVAVSWFFYWLSLRRLARPAGRRVPVSRASQLRRTLLFALAVTAVASGAFWLGTHDDHHPDPFASGLVNLPPGPAGGSASGSGEVPSGPGPGQDTIPDGPVSISVNGVPLPTRGFVKDRVVMVPMEDVFTALGAAVLSDATRGTVTAVRGTTTAVVKIGTTEAYASDWRLTLDAPAMSIDSATYVPLRFCLTSFGAQIGFDAAARLAEIGCPGPGIPETELHLTGYEPLIDRSDFDEAVAHAAEYRDQSALMAAYTRVVEEGQWAVYASIITPWGSAAESVWWMMRQELAINGEYISGQLGDHDGKLGFAVWVPLAVDALSDARYTAVLYQDGVAHSLRQQNTMSRGTGYAGLNWLLMTFTVESARLSPRGPIVLIVTDASGTSRTFEWNLDTLR
jgi:hypothetical protein